MPGFQSFFRFFVSVCIGQINPTAAYKGSASSAVVIGGEL